MLQIVVLCREIPDDIGRAQIAEDPGTTALTFYPIRDLLRKHGFVFPSGELAYVDSDTGELIYHKLINQDASVASMIDENPKVDVNPASNTPMIRM